jgi:choline monooxygenase
MANDLSPVLRDVARAQGLPNAHYTDPATWTAERDKLLCAASAAARPSGRGAGLQNVCRHRGMILVDAPEEDRGAIRCPYHSWCYAKDGRLVATPHVGGPGQNAHPGIDRKTLGLIEVPSHIWRDVVFVNLSGDADPFEEIHADIIARWAEFDQPMYHGGPDSTLHAGSRHQLETRGRELLRKLPPALGASRPQQLFPAGGSLQYRGAASVFGPGHPRLPPAARARRVGLPRFRRSAGEMGHGAEYIALYPNVLLGVHRDHAFAIVLEPRGP